MKGAANLHQIDRVLTVQWMYSIRTLNVRWGAMVEVGMGADDHLGY